MKNTFLNFINQFLIIQYDETSIKVTSEKGSSWLDKRLKIKHMRINYENSWDMKKILIIYLKLCLKTLGLYLFYFRGKKARMIDKKTKK